MDLDDVNDLEYSCSALDEPTGFNWFSLNETTRLSYATLQTGLNTTPGIQQAGA